MKSYLALITVIILFITGCEKKASETKSGSLKLTGISSTKASEMVTIDLDSGFVSTIPMDCHVMSSTVYDPSTAGYGYVDCDTVFKLIDPENGDVIKSVKLPGLLSDVIIDEGSNMLIGVYREYLDNGGQDSSLYTSELVLKTYLLAMKLATDEVCLNKEIDLGDGISLCTHYFDPVKSRYVMERSDKVLLFIDPARGEVAETTAIGKTLTNIVFNKDEGNIMSMRYDGETEKCYIEVYDPLSGTLLSSSLVDGLDGYRYCMAAYDPVTECYLTVSRDDEVLFIVPSTGEIKKRVKLGYQLSDIRFLRK